MAIVSGVPQGSVLGPLLFIIFIEDIDTCANIISIINKFADDTKLGQSLTNPDSHLQLQHCLNNLSVWAQNWCMNFNESKCTVLHIGKNNPKHTYTLNDIALQATDCEKDVGIHIHSNLKPSNHCAVVAGRARNILGQIARTFHYRDKHTFLKLYTTYVRVHLEFAVPAWSPWLLGDINKLEAIQEQAVKMISGLKSTSYEGKLQELGLSTLKERQDRFDMVETYKIIKGINRVDHSQWFTLLEDTNLRQTRSRQCPINIVPQHSNNNVRRHFFTNRICNTWNKQPGKIKDAPSVNRFKKLYIKWCGMSNADATS